MCGANDFSDFRRLRLSGRRILRDRFGEPTSLPRPSISQLIQSHVEREAIERGARNHGDGMIVQEEKEFIGAAAMIDPGFGFKARIENGWTCLGKIHFVAGTWAPPRTWMDFIKHDHRRSPDEMGNAANLVHN